MSDLTDEAIPIAVVGATGRMGRRLVAIAHASKKFKLVCAIVKPDHAMLARDAGEVAGGGAMNLSLSFDLRPTPKVLIDFSAPAATRHWLKVCRDRNIAMLIGTTGLQKDDHDAIEEAARDIPIIQATNTSLGVAVLNKLVAQAAKQLGDEYDIEVVEAHHRFKKDAPSGTANSIVNALIDATGRTKSDVALGRHGSESTRGSKQIGVHSMRIGDETGTHSVYFATLGERLELTHRATNRDTFVHGALRAAAWLSIQKPGRYQIADVLGV